MKKEEMKQQQYLYQGKIITLRKDEVFTSAKRLTTREIIETPNGVGVLCVDYEGMLYLIKQYRYAVQSLLIEIPAGKVERNETSEDCARRELLEETGIEAKTFQFLLKTFPTPGYSEESIELYLAKDIISIQQQNLDEDEDIEILKMTLDQALDSIKNGVIKDSKTINAIAYYALLKYNEN